MWDGVHKGDDYGVVRQEKALSMSEGERYEVVVK